MSWVNAINRNFKRFFFSFFFLYLFSEGKMLDLFYLSFNSALCAFAHFSFDFANIWKRAAGEAAYPHMKQKKFLSWPTNPQPLLVALQNVLLSPSISTGKGWVGSPWESCTCHRAALYSQGDLQSALPHLTRWVCLSAGLLPAQPFTSFNSSSGH